MTTYGSNVLRDVKTLIDPSTKFNSHRIPWGLRAAVTAGHTSRRYFSLYFGKSVANEDSSSIPVGLSSAEILTTCHLSTSPVSHGLSFLYCLRSKTTVAVILKPY